MGLRFGLGILEFRRLFRDGIRIWTFWVLGSRIRIDLNLGESSKAEFEFWLVKNWIRVGPNPRKSSKAVLELGSDCSEITLILLSFLYLRLYSDGIFIRIEKNRNSNHY
jgi:hypothetical protein